MNGEKIFAGPADRNRDRLAADCPVCDRQRSDPGAWTVRGGEEDEESTNIDV